jgi:hypothetical protein
VILGVAHIFFEYRDLAQLPRKGPDGRLHDLCTDYDIDNNVCGQYERNNFITNNSTTWTPFVPIERAHTLLSNHSRPEDYLIRFVPERTGFYCYGLYFHNVQTPGHLVTTNVQVVNPYGLLPGEEYPHLPVRSLISKFVFFRDVVLRHHFARLSLCCHLVVCVDCIALARHSHCSTLDCRCALYVNVGQCLPLWFL